MKQTERRFVANGRKAIVRKVSGGYDLLKFHSEKDLMTHDITKWPRHWMAVNIAKQFVEAA